MKQIAPDSLSYILTRKSRAVLNQPVTFNTDIKGFRAVHKAGTQKVYLTPDGTFTVFVGFVWDFGSGPAIDTPEVVIASLAHDALCWLIDEGKLPWSQRKKADKLYRKILKEKDVWWIRRWYHFLAVRSYSLFKQLTGPTKDWVKHKFKKVS